MHGEDNALPDKAHASSHRKDDLFHDMRQRSSETLRQKSSESLPQKSSALLSQRSYGSASSKVSTNRQGCVDGFLTFPLGTKTGHTSLRGASITCVETFVPHGGPEMVLMMPSGRGIQGPKVDKLLAGEWVRTMQIDKKGNALHEKPIYDSATDCVHPETLLTAMEQKLRINHCNHMLDKKRAEMEKSRIYRQKRLEEEKNRKILKMQEAEQKRQTEAERQERKAKALQDEIQANIEDRKLMLEKIRREAAALYNSAANPSPKISRSKSFARSMGFTTRDESFATSPCL